MTKPHSIYRKKCSLSAKVTFNLFSNRDKHFLNHFYHNAIPDNVTLNLTLILKAHPHCFVFFAGRGLSAESSIHQSANDLIFALNHLEEV